MYFDMFRETNSHTATGGSTRMWSALSKDEIALLFTQQDLYDQDDYTLYKFHIHQMGEVLRQVGNSGEKYVYLTFPDPYGGSTTFGIWETKAGSENSTRYFKGYSVAKSSTKIDLTFSSRRLQAVIVSDRDEWVISPIHAKDCIYLVHKKN